MINNIISLERKKSYIINIMKMGFQRSLNSFSHLNIDIDKLTDNLYNYITKRHLNELNGYSVLGTVFFILKSSYEYYSLQNNSTMKDYISLSILEKHLMFLEGELDLFIEEVNFLDEMIIEASLELVY